MVPVIPEVPDSPRQGWSPEKIPMPDSIFRPPTPEPAPQPEPVVVDVESDEDESAIDDDADIIVDERTPADLNRQSAKRDKKTLTIVLSLAIIMAGIVAIALLVVLL